jgi:hypothetical protein
MRVARVATVGTAAALVLAAATAWATPPSDGVYEYVIERNGSRIGDHRVRFRSHGSRVMVEHRVRIRVSVAGWDAYVYELDSRESWAGDRLVALHSRTNKNGERLEVLANGMRRGVLVNTRDGARRAPASIVTASPSWNVLERRPDRMLDAESGATWRVTVSEGRDEPVRIAGRTVPCRRFRVRGDLDAMLWYGPGGVLVKKRLRAPDDSSIVTALRRFPDGSP